MVACWRRENSPGVGLLSMQTDVLVKALPKAKPEVRIYMQIVYWVEPPRNYQRGNGKRGREGKGADEGCVVE